MASLVGGAAHTHTHTTRSLAEALRRANCLVGAGQTPASWSLLSPFAFSSLLSLFLSSLFLLGLFLLRTYLFLFRTSLSSQNVSLSLFPHFLYLRTSLLTERLSSQNVSPHRTYLMLSLARFYIPGPSPQGAVHPKLTPPHWGTVTMTTRALSKKASVGAREEMLLRKNEGGLQSSRKNVCERVCLRKKASHKRRDLSFTILNTSHLRSH